MSKSSKIKALNRVQSSAECTLFISDLHLSPAIPERTQRFHEWTQSQHDQCKHLFILGDLFDYWVGDDDDSDCASQVCTALAALSSTGTRISLMHGNRDFLLGEGFARRCGANLIGADHLTLELFGTHTVICHGDTLCTRDQDYQTLRSELRSEAWQSEFLALPLSERHARALQMRASSAAATPLKDPAALDVDTAAARKLMLSEGASRLIHGHTHQPQRCSVDLNGKPGERIVLGEWTDHAIGLKATSKSLELYNFL